ncbi:MAG: glycosyltransferase [Actinobacillus minor]|nr:glycosyltransferase [Actinobacillus minor]
MTEEEKKLSIEEAEKADLVKILEMERGMVTQADFIKILGEYDNYILKYPDVLTAYVNRANTLQKLGLYEMALRDVDYAISRKKNYGFAYCHRSFISILLGRYEEGWKEFEWRLDGMVKDSTVKDWPISRWQGEDLNGNTLIILPEQGLGDVIQFIRYAIVAKEQGLNIVVKNRDALDGLLSYSLRKHGIPILGRDPIPSAVAAYAHVMSFPHLFKTTLENIPYSEKYLEVEPEFEQKWRNLLGQKGYKKRIGVVWAGSKDHNRFRSRNMSFEQISSLFALDAEFYCLQKEVDPEDREKAKAFSNLSFWDDKIESFSDTAGLVSQLDLVISVDTSVAHLSAAMAIPTWIMITYNPDFRWLLERDDSPWYDSVRLFRQSISLTWESVIENVKESLKKEL